MPGKVKVGGTWRDSTAPYVRVGGNWKIAKSAWAKVDDKWRSWFLQGGVNDSQFNLIDNQNKFNNNIRAVAIQSNGQIILGGEFTIFNGATVNRIVRLNSDGTLDTAFSTNTGTGANFTIWSIAIQSDGKIVIGGGFATFNGATVNRIVRLNSDGTRDTAFTTNTGMGPNSVVLAIAIQPNGQIVIGGDFITFNGATVNRIARLNSDGTRDTAFTANTGTGGNSSVLAIAIQANSQIVIGGGFATFNGATVNYIVRLNSDGTRDTAFTANTGTATNNSIRAVAIQSNGQIVIGGDFITFNGVTVNRIARLNSDGTRDTAFTANTGTGATSTINAVAIQTDGKIVLVGAIAVFNGVTVNGIVRLNSDGTGDTAFTANTGTGAVSVFAIAIQTDGKIVVGGFFTTFNGVTVNRSVRLNSDGSIENSIFSNVSIGFNNVLWSIAIQSDGKIVVGGFFTTFNGVTVNNIVRLNSDGTLDTAFTANTGAGTTGTVFAIAIQSDGKIVIGGSFATFNGAAVNRIARLNSDGTRDTEFTTNTGTAANHPVSSIAIQSNGQILLAGAFTSWNGTSRIQAARLNSNGTLDLSFNPTSIFEFGQGLTPSVIALQADGKFVISRNFEDSEDEREFHNFERYNSNGTRDTTFPALRARGVINAIAIQPNGQIVLGGAFTIFNGVGATRIVRLNSDGTRDTAFTANVGTGANSTISAIAIQSDGKIVIGGLLATFNGATVNQIARLNSNGTRDAEFTTNTGLGTIAAGLGVLRTIAIQSDGKIVIGGSFLTFNNINRSHIARLGGDLAG